MYKILKIIHHTAGLIGSLLVLLMSITGILLNHRSLIGYSSNTAFELQKFIFALHSGSVGNTSIVWLTDLGAICMIVLGISGVWMWFQLVKKRRRSKKMIKKFLVVIMGTILALSLSACGTSQSNNQSQNKSSNQGSKSSQDNSMKGMKMGNQQLTKAFQDELNGFTTIEQDVNKGDYTSASTLASNLHDEFHAAILPPLTAKKGKTYAENIHGKYDELQDAVTSKDNTKIAELIKVNRDNLNTVAKILGVSLK